MTEPTGLPPYTYVPGRAPHPIGDPRGHGCAGPELSCGCSMDGWMRLESYEWAVRLFNHGYFWEAHESWEELWLLEGRKGPTADFLKALIKLAAAGVKLYEGNLAGVHRHAARAKELLDGIQAAHYGRMHLREVHAIGDQFLQLKAAPTIDDPRNPPQHPEFQLALLDA